MIRIVLISLLLLTALNILGQERGKKIIISCPDIEDIKTIDIVDEFLTDSILAKNEFETIVLFDNYGLFSIKGFDNEVPFDSINFYCSEDYSRIKNLITKENVKLYGTTVSSDMITYLRVKNKSNYNELDSLSHLVGNKSFGSLFIYNELKNYPQLIDFVIEKYKLNCTEAFILKTSILDKSKFKNIISDSVICEISSTPKNIIWIRDWTSPNPIINDVIQMNIIPAKLNLSTTNNKIRKNVIAIPVNHKGIQLIEYENLPKKINLNDFLTKVDKVELQNDINIYVPFTKSCRH